MEFILADMQDTGEGGPGTSAVLRQVVGQRQPEGQMPWVAGIDEAGYGPALGPLVQAVVVLRLPAKDLAGWRTLQGVIRRTDEPVDDRLLVDDSKQVHSRQGWAGLEEGVARTLHLARQSWNRWLAALALPSCLAELEREKWYDPTEQLPRQEHPPLQQEPFPVQARLRLLTAAAFNRQCDQLGNKAETLGFGWAELVRSLFAPNGPLPPAIPQDGEKVVIQSDKLGGRHYYSALLQESFPGRWVMPLHESAGLSRYRIEDEERPVEVHFRPEAETHSVATALASMLAKYVREICMDQFNRYWRQLLPELPSTSGYLPHARQWYTRIAPLLSNQGLRSDDVWRRR